MADRQPALGGAGDSFIRLQPQHIRGLRFPSSLALQMLTAARLDICAALLMGKYDNG